MTKPADGKTLSSRWAEHARRWIPIIGLTALAAALRLLFLDNIPPGLYHDEAYNGLDALGVLKGEHTIYFPANQGREPLFIYLIAATVGLLGRTPGALRLAASISGILTIPATYLLARTWFNERIGFLSAAILTSTYWHVHLSRVGFRAVMLPLAITLALWAAGRAFRSRRRDMWLLAGIVYGISFYTYVAARFTPIVILALVIYLSLAGQRERLWPGIAYFSAGAFVVLLPLGVHTLTHWDVVMGRPGQVSVFNPLIHGGEPVGTVMRQLLDTLGMFFMRGDTIPRHNLPGRPVFDPFMAGAMILGTGFSVVRARRGDVASGAVLIWVGLMLVPTWLAEDAPHFLRAVGILPLVVVLPALGLEAITDWPDRLKWYGWGRAIIGGMLLISLAMTVRDYFVRYASRPEVRYAFEDAAVDLAAEINTFLGVGWDGDGIAASSTSRRLDHHVFLDSRVWEEWTSTAFLIPEIEQRTVFSPNDPPTPTGPAMVVVWPHDGIRRYADALPHRSRITAWAGPLTRGDLEETSYTAYVVYHVVPETNPPARSIATFDDGIALTGYALEVAGDTSEVTLEWMALNTPGGDYTVSVRLFDDDDLVAQSDTEPGDGYYPTGLWREGDLVVDRHVLGLAGDGPDNARLEVGLYVWPTMEHLSVRSSEGDPLGTWLSLPVPAIDGDNSE